MPRGSMLIGESVVIVASFVGHSCIVGLEKARDGMAKVMLRSICW